jgi:hypothetical protein
VATFWSSRTGDQLCRHRRSCMASIQQLQAIPAAIATATSRCLGVKAAPFSIGVWLRLQSWVQGLPLAVQQAH